MDQRLTTDSDVDKASGVDDRGSSGSVDGNVPSVNADEGGSSSTGVNGGNADVSDGRVVEGISVGVISGVSDENGVISEIPEDPGDSADDGGLGSGGLDASVLDPANGVDIGVTSETEPSDDTDGSEDGALETGGLDIAGMDGVGGLDMPKGTDGATVADGMPSMDTERSDGPKDGELLVSSSNEAE